MTEKTKITIEIREYEDKFIFLEMSHYNREVNKLTEDTKVVILEHPLGNESTDELEND